MIEDFIGKVFPAVVETVYGKKLRYKNLAEDFTAFNQFFFEYLNTFNIPTVFVEKTDSITLRYSRHNLLLFYVRISNYVDEHYYKVFSKPLWDAYSIPVIEYYHVNYPLTVISQNHIIALGLTGVDELKLINRLCTKINAVLKSFFERREQYLVSTDCFFGKTNDKFVVCGEFNPLHLRYIDRNDMQNATENLFDFRDSNRLKKKSENLLSIIRT